METQVVWGGLLPIYLFLGGMGGSILVIAPLVDFLSGRHCDRTVKFCAWSAVVFVALGSVCLLVETGRPLRSLNLLVAFINLSSWLSVGAWGLFATGIVGLAYALVLTLEYTDSGRFVRFMHSTFAVLCIVLGLFTSAYTGMLLRASHAVVTWSTLLLPALFVTSSFSAGFAYVSIAARLVGRRIKERLLRVPLKWWQIACALLDSVFLILYLLWMNGASTVTAYAASTLLNGGYAMPFWACVVACGVVIPLVTSVIDVLSEKGLPAIEITDSVSVWIGSFTLRILVLAIGMYAPLSFITL